MLRPAFQPRRAVALLALMPVLALTGCSGAFPLSGRGGDAPVAAPDRLIIQVESQFADDVEVLIVLAGATSRLGYVASNTYERYAIDRSRFAGRGQVQMIARTLIGGSEYVSPPVVVNEGEGLLFRIGASLSFSQLIVRR